MALGGEAFVERHHWWRLGQHNRIRVCKSQAEQTVLRQNKYNYITQYDVRLFTYSVLEHFLSRSGLHLISGKQTRLTQAV